jgi:hypothetical protein
MAPGFEAEPRKEGCSIGNRKDAWAPGVGSRTRSDWPDLFALGKVLEFSIHDGELSLKEPSLIRCIGKPATSWQS